MPLLFILFQIMPTQFFFGGGLPCRRILVLLFAAFILYHKKVTQISDTRNLVPTFSWYHIPVQNKKVSRIKHFLVADHFKLEKGQHKCLHVVTTTHYTHIHFNFMFFWLCIMNWLYINYQLDALIIIYS